QGDQEGGRRVEGFNARGALVITRRVRTTACAYLFGLIALISLPDAITTWNGVCRDIQQGRRPSELGMVSTWSGQARSDCRPTLGSSQTAPSRLAKSVDLW